MLIMYENDTYAFSVSLNNFFLIEIISWIFRGISSKKGIPRYNDFTVSSQTFLFLAIAVLKCVYYIFELCLKFSYSFNFWSELLNI